MVFSNNPVLLNKKWDFKWAFKSGICRKLWPKYHEDPVKRPFHFIKNSKIQLTKTCRNYHLIHVKWEDFYEEEKQFPKHGRFLVRINILPEI